MAKAKTEAKKPKVLAASTVESEAFKVFARDSKAPTAEIVLAETLVTYATRMMGETGEPLDKSIIDRWAERKRSITEANMRGIGRKIGDTDARKATLSENRAVFVLGTLPGGLRAFTVAKNVARNWTELRKCAQSFRKAYNKSGKGDDRVMPNDASLKRVALGVVDKSKKPRGAQSAKSLAGQAHGLLALLKKKVRGPMRDKVVNAFKSLTSVYETLKKDDAK